MTLLTSFFIIYGLGHLYAFLKIRSTFSLNTAAGIVLALILILMTLSPYLIHIYSINGSTVQVRIVSYIGFIWMAFLFLFICVSLPIDTYNLLVISGGAVLKKDLAAIMVPSRVAFFLALCLSIIICVYGYFEAKELRTEKITIETSKLPETVDKLTIVHISDLHLGVIVREDRLKKVLTEIKAAKPDLIVATGDILDGQGRFVNHYAETLNSIQPRLGKFAVTGNHEFYVGIDHSLRFLKEAGFTVLTGEGVTVQDLINIAGVHDRTAKRMHPEMPLTSEEEILSKLPSDKFTLFLKHRPDIDRNSLGLFDLQLSGHTHKGQIFPFSLVTAFYYKKMDSGFFELSKGSAVYISRGAGTAGPPIRFLSPPEITVIEIVRKGKAWTPKSWGRPIRTFPKSKTKTRGWGK